MMKQFLTKLVVVLVVAVALVMAAPAIEESKNATSVSEHKNSLNTRGCTWIDGDFEISSQNHARTAIYNIQIGADKYKWKEMMLPFSNPKKTCHKSGVVCAKAATTGSSVHIWYANTDQEYGTTNNKYDYTCDTIERRGEPDLAQFEESSVDKEKRGLKVCWSWQTFNIHGCFGEGYHSK